MKFRSVSFIAFAGMLSSEFLSGATPVVITNALRGTIGVAASTSQLLFTQPFCTTTGVPRGVYSVNTTTGVPTLYAALPELGVGGCLENYLTLSMGSGGFTAGATYVTQDGMIYVVPPGGGSATPMTLTGSALTAFDGHSGIGFDTVGTFGFRLIFTSDDGVWLISAAGVSTKIAAGIGANVHIESPAVAPSPGFGAFSGFLFMTAEDDNVGGGNGPASGVYYVAPGAIVPANPPTKFVGMPGSAPEAIQFVPQNTCSLNVMGRAYQGFSSDYSQSVVGQRFPTDSAIVGFPTTDFTGLAGKAIVTFEYALGTGYSLLPDLEVMDVSGIQTPFSNLSVQLEGFNLITCNVPVPPQPPPPTCPLTIGYWKNHTSAWKTIFPYTIGGFSYSASNFLTLLNTPPKGDAKIILAQQLVGAILNVANGAPATTLIGQANALLTNNGINLLTSAGVSPAGALGQQMVNLAAQLQTYNSSCE